MQPESISIDSSPSTGNRITSAGTKRQKVKLTPEEMKSKSGKLGKCGGVCNVFNGLNHSIAGVAHTFHKTDPKSEYE